MNYKLSVEEQILFLKDEGLQIADETKAKEILQDIGYYRLGFYLFPFKDKESGRFNADTKIEDAITLYYLDSDLRHILTKYLIRIEIAFRTKMIYSLSNKYADCPTWFVNENVVTSSYAKSFKRRYPKLLNNDIILKHHKKHHDDLYAPAWKTLEFMTFGETVLLYSNLKEVGDQLLISRSFGINQTKVFNSYIESTKILRNICAHGSVLFDLKLRKSISRGPAYKVNGINGSTLEAVINVVNFLLSQISMNRVKDMQKEIKKAVRQAKKKCNKIKTIVNITFS